ncbi:hypothetical protein [Streptomyces sp. 1331.2]|uniref:hypothetical protein n=1 Tax=Streptomyces sp. 1331.2 TaxID=1938835 RepID=UPI000BD5B215|nr:hypothetical protein [Streptomyces sp. 1331.2]SOB83152.1 hypothetical protein SAMN06272789_3350 [Streptomyces sp. 1331.2]
MYYTANIRRAAEQLRTVREEWGALLVAIETPPADAWPPVKLSAHLARQQAGDEQLLDVVDRVPLTLRQHPAPANLDALDAATRVEGLLFDLADTLAAAVQRPIGRRLVSAPGRPPRWGVEEVDAGDPRRWTYRSPTDPGSRRHGLHWAALFVEGRLLDEDATPEPRGDRIREPALFGLLPEHLRHEAVRVAGQAERLVLRALRIDPREQVIEGRPCPWCAGELTLHTHPQDTPRVTCATGPRCPAPVPLDDRCRRAWGVDEMFALVVTLNESHAPKIGLRDSRS